MDFQTKPTTKTTVAIPKPGYFVHKFSIANINDVNIPAIIAARCFSLEYRIDKQVISNATQNWISVVIHIVQSTSSVIEIFAALSKMIIFDSSRPARACAVHRFHRFVE